MVLSLVDVNCCFVVLIWRSITVKVPCASYLEGDLPHERRALVGGEDGELVVVEEAALVRLVVLVGPRLVRPEGHDGLARRVHR